MYPRPPCRSFRHSLACFPWLADWDYCRCREGVAPFPSIRSLQQCEGRIRRSFGTAH